MEFILENLYIILSVLFVFVTIFLYLQNNLLTIKQITLTKKNLPKSADGLRILQISDLHSKRFGRGQQTIADKIKRQKPDIILITGDIIDRRRFNIYPVIELLSGIQDIAPIYYSPGNHEGWSGRYDEVRKVLEKFSVNILENSSANLTKNTAMKGISINGILDPAFDLAEGSGVLKSNQQTKRYLNSFSMNDGFNITLCHRPEAVEGVDGYMGEIVFSGHVHGGQVRIWPFGGLYAPGQGILPKYDSGVYEINDTTLIVSRGLGNSLFPFRVFNLPQLVVVTLRS